MECDRTRALVDRMFDGRAVGCPVGWEDVRQTAHSAGDTGHVKWARSAYGEGLQGQQHSAEVL
jgi:hypothetical protein